MSWIVCGFCGKKKKNPAMIFKSFGVCEECIKKLPYSDGNGCFEAMKPLDYVIAPLYYSGVVKWTIRDYKFHNKTAYADIFAEFIAERMRDLPHLYDFDFACAVPLSKMRMLERGYNQSELIAVRVCKKIGMDYRDILIRTRETKRQTDLDIMQRMENVRGAFECCANVSGKRILLFDDIYTHGFTASETAKALIARGGDSVVCITAAIVK